MIRSVVFRPDITEMVDWALNTNYLPTISLSLFIYLWTHSSIYLSLYLFLDPEGRGGTIDDLRNQLPPSLSSAALCGCGTSSPVHSLTPSSPSPYSPHCDFQVGYSILFFIRPPKTKSLSTAILEPI